MGRLVLLRVDVDRVRRYFRENWGAPFVVGFQLLLMACAGLLVRGDSVLANEVAVYAYYMLVIGVVLQLVSFMRGRKGTSEQGMEKNKKIGLILFVCALIGLIWSLSIYTTNVPATDVQLSTVVTLDHEPYILNSQPIMHATRDAPLNLGWVRTKNQWEISNYFIDIKDLDYKYVRLQIYKQAGASETIVVDEALPVTSQVFTVNGVIYRRYGGTKTFYTTDPIGTEYRVRWIAEHVSGMYLVDRGTWMKIVSGDAKASEGTC